MSQIFRATYAKTPMSLRVRFGRAWRLRSRINRLRFSESKVNERLAETNLFFLLGSGRCGTLLISRMLNQDPNAVVLHEPHRHCDLTVRNDCRKHPRAATRYVRIFRKYEIYKKIKEKNAPTYGEVSSPLRCLGGALRQSLPNAKFFILVRDGRATVRSAMNRQAPRKSTNNHPPTIPLHDDHPYVEKWNKMTDFEQTCWWWMDSYRTLLQHLPDTPVLHFEKITTDYDYVKKEILDPIGLQLSKDQYDASMSRKSANAAKQYTIPHWNDWDDAMRKQFDGICGSMMERLGYDRNQ